MTEVDSTVWIRENVKCCACGRPMKNSKNINGICLDKLATWENPVWGNILVKEKYPEKRAVAIICDDCVAKKSKIKFAVSWSNEYTNIQYHKIEELKDLPPIKEKDVLEAELKAGMYKTTGYGVV